MTKTVDSNSKRATSSGRRAIKHKPKDRPKRPLSAYNYFFKYEREKIMKAVNCEGKLHWKEIDSELSEENIENLKSRDGKVKFKEMGKIIGSRWRNVNAEDKKRCNFLAKGDKKRYADEVETYHQKKENMRHESHAFTEYERMISQEQLQGPPFVQSTPSIKNEYHMGYMHSYRNTYGYGQMPMMTAPNHYYMPPPPANEGHFGYNSLLQNESSTSYENDSRFYPRNEHISSSGYSQSYRYSAPHAHDGVQYPYGQQETLNASNLNAYQVQPLNGAF